LDYYYKDFLAWYDNKLNSVPVIEPDPVIPKPIKIKIKPSKPREPPADVPEPMIAMLLGMGLLGVRLITKI